MNLSYTPAQQLVFFGDNPRFTIVAKGRRVGLTRGAAQALIEKCLIQNLRVLWIETIYSNVQRYYDLYFQPILDQLPTSMWVWSARLTQLSIGKSVIDFRSADNPESIEGFAYNIIFLNEAGIILKDTDLYKKTVLLMLMDYPDSKLIAAGVPKAKKLRNGEEHIFYSLWKNAENNPAYKRYKFSTRDNPFLRPEDIKDIEDVLDEKTRLQEIEGEFIDVTDNPYLYEFDSDKHVTPTTYTPDERLPIWIAFDFNIEPNSAIVGQQPDQFSGITFDELSVKGSTEEVCDVILSRYGHWLQRGLVFVTGDATGKNRNAMSGELTNYILIKKKLKLTDRNLKVRHTNMMLKSSRVLCNSILSKGDVKITANCKVTISDCQMASVDGSGDLIKDTGMHKLDCQRYLLEAWFPDFLDKGHKYIRPKSIKPAAPMKLQEVGRDKFESRMLDVMRNR